MKKILKIALNILVITAILLATAVAIYFIYKTQKEKNSEENILSYTELINEINNDNVEKIEMTVGSTSARWVNHSNCTASWTPLRGT